MFRKIDTDEKKINELLTRGVAEVIQPDSLKKKLLSGRQLRIKLGIDPTSPDIHLGRTVPLMKLRDFQELGHKIVFIIGDATGVIGDTSDKESERPMLTRKQVEQNLKSYFIQAGKILDMGKVEKHRNSEWLNKLTLNQLGELADKFSVSDFTSREVIKRRLTAGKRVSLREMLYPLMQGYDSVAVRADVELGGTDQKFNLLAGRTLQEIPQDIMMFDLIPGLDGRKMSSSWGNTINVFDDSKEMYGKVMSMGDDGVRQYFIAITRISLQEIDEIMNTHPRDAKMRLAKEIVTFYYGDKKATKAEESFVSTFSKGEVPEEVEEIKKEELLIDTLVNNEIISSRSEFRRLVEGGAITNMDTNGKVTDVNSKAEVGTYKVGKKRFVRIVDKS